MQPSSATFFICLHWGLQLTHSHSRTHVPHQQSYGLDTSSATLIKVVIGYDALIWHGYGWGIPWIWQRHRFHTLKVKYLIRNDMILCLFLSIQVSQVKEQQVGLLHCKELNVGLDIMQEVKIQNSIIRWLEIAASMGKMPLTVLLL